MEKSLTDFNINTRLRHCFSWGFSPLIYQEKFYVIKNNSIVPELAQRIFEDFEWEVIYADPQLVKATRENQHGEIQEIVSVSVSGNHSVQVSSKSHKKIFWDNGKNSKVVLSVILALQNKLKKLSTEEIAELELLQQKKSGIGDYVVPLSLPEPVIYKEPSFSEIGTAGLLTALFSAFVFAFLQVKFVYIIGLYELGVALLFAFVLGKMLKKNNYTDGRNLQKLLIWMTGLFFISDLWFQYKLVDLPGDLGFIDFIRLKLKQGLEINKVNTGWIGMILSWIFQLFIVFFIAGLKMTQSILKYILNKVPVEVIDFAFYYWVKEKNELKVNQHLAQMGWDDETSQKDVWEAIAARQQLSKQAKEF